MPYHRPRSCAVHRRGLGQRRADVLKSGDVDEHVIPRALPDGRKAHGIERLPPVAEPADLPCLRDVQQRDRRTVHTAVKEHPYKADDNQTHQIRQEKDGAEKLFAMHAPIEQQRESKRRQIGSQRDENRILYRYPERAAKGRVGQRLPVVPQPHKVLLRVVAVSVGERKPQAFSERDDEKSREKRSGGKNKADIYGVLPASPLLHGILPSAEKGQENFRFSCPFRSVYSVYACPAALAAAQASSSVFMASSRETRSRM